MKPKFNRICDKKRCHALALSEPDFSRSAKVYTWVVGDTERVIIAHPHSPIEGEALCYFHRHFRDYPMAETFWRRR